MTNHNKKHNKHKKHHKAHSRRSNNSRAITQKNKTIGQKIKKVIKSFINFFKNLFSKKTKKTNPEKNKQLTIKDKYFFNKVENLILSTQSVSELTTPLYSAYMNDPDIARIGKLINGQIPVNEANLDFQNLLASEDVIEHLLKSNKVSPKVKEKIQEIQDNIDRKKQKLHAQPGFKSKPSDKPKPRI